MMSRYLFIQSQDPFTDIMCEKDFSLIAELSHNGNDVAIFLVQNGVAPAARNSVAHRFDELARSSVTIYADAFSLQQREIQISDLKPEVKPAALDVVIDAMLSGDKVIWN